MEEQLQLDDGMHAAAPVTGTHGLSTHPTVIRGINEAHHCTPTREARRGAQQAASIPIVGNRIAFGVLGGAGADDKRAKPSAWALGATEQLSTSDRRERKHDTHG